MGILLFCQADSRLQSYAGQNARVRMLVRMRSRVCFLLYDFLILFFSGRMALIIARTTTLIIVIIIMGILLFWSFSRQRARAWHVRIRVRVLSFFIMFGADCNPFCQKSARTDVCVCVRQCECVWAWACVRGRRFYASVFLFPDAQCWLMPFFSGRMALIIARTTTLITVLIMGILLLCQADCHDQNSSIKRRASTKILTLAACILHCFFCFCVSMFLLFMMFDVDQCHSFQERWKYFSVKLKPTAIPF